MDKDRKEIIDELIKKLPNRPTQICENCTSEYLEDSTIKEIAKQLLISNKLKLLELHWNYTISDIVDTEFKDTYIKIEKELHGGD